MEKTNLNQPKHFSYLIQAFVAFGFLGLEFGVLFISRIIDGRSMAEFGLWPFHWYGAVAHWSITIIVWLLGLVFIVLWLKKQHVLHNLVDFKFSFSTIAIAFAIVLGSAFVDSLVSVGQFPQVLFEYRGFQSMYPYHTLIVITFQILYYFVEMLLVFTMIALFQHFGELAFKLTWIPYGSIGLLLTWGLIHFASHPAGALGVSIWALIPGLLFVYGKKQFFPVYIMLVLGFIL